MTQSELLNRASGILFHPTSLPGPFGIGDLGPEAHAWIDTLARTGQGWWQVLPVGPTGYGDSPYQSPSTFAGNLNLISPERLADDKLVSRDEVEACRVAGGGSANPSSGPSPEKGGGSAPPSLSGKGVGGLGSEGPIDYADVIPRKQRLVQRAWERFRAGDGNPALRGEFARFYAEEAGWLDEFALFMAIKNAEGGKPWWEWPSPLAMHDGPALDAARQRLADEIDAHRFGQFLFFRQWKAVREHAHQSGVKIIGDLPIYIARDSADVWGHPELFQLDETRQPQVVAGVPPDYFSSTGQLWGNPIYNWTVHHTTRYAWWLDRIRAALRIFDLIRLDHFRGIEAYWAVPFGDSVATHGKWFKGPGADLLRALRDGLGEVPIIAEDLGFITSEVDALREQFQLPGMRILQFAFGGAVEERFLPHRYEQNVVVYTGTHDNDTTAGWAEKLTQDERDRYSRYAPLSTAEPVETLIRLGWGSVATLALAPLQDFLGLGSEARLNAPGTAIGNWCWRVDERSLKKIEWVEFLRDVTEIYERKAAIASTR